MNTDPTHEAADDPRSLLSALADGDAAAAEAACRSWRETADARAAWHVYHLIGDVMRSDDLAAAPARDLRFLAALQTRLAAEPVVLAPARRRPAWLLPAAAAASFVAVAGVVGVARYGAADAGAALSAGRAPDTAITLAGTAAAPAAPLLVEGRMIRDPQIDRYLRAHRSMFAAGAMTVPGAAPRSVEVLMPAEAMAKPVAR